MVFPSMFAKIETGLISQSSIYAVIAFSFLLYYWKRILIILTGLSIVAILVYSNSSHAALGLPGTCGSSCMNNINYYGFPYGGYGVYPYPFLSYHSLYGPRQYYFYPYGPSPYQPVDCIACMQRYQQFSSPMFSQPITYTDRFYPVKDLLND